MEKLKKVIVILAFLIFTPAAVIALPPPPKPPPPPVKMKSGNVSLPQTGSWLRSFYSWYKRFMRHHTCDWKLVRVTKNHLIYRCPQCKKYKTERRK
jgi:hypothetical protein